MNLGNTELLGADIPTYEPMRSASPSSEGAERSRVIDAVGYEREAEQASLG
jgi:hypothetical protein